MIHHNLQGLAFEAGLNPQELLSEEFADAMGSFNDDFDLATSLLELQAKYGSASRRLPSISASDLPGTGNWGFLFDEENLDLWAHDLSILSCLALGLVSSKFLNSASELKGMDRNWLENVKSRPHPIGKARLGPIDDSDNRDPVIEDTESF